MQGNISFAMSANLDTQNKSIYQSFGFAKYHQNKKLVTHESVVEVSVRNAVLRIGLVRGARRHHIVGYEVIARACGRSSVLPQHRVVVVLAAAACGRETVVVFLAQEELHGAGAVGSVVRRSVVRLHHKAFSRGNGDEFILRAIINDVVAAADGLEIVGSFLVCAVIVGIDLLSDAICSR